MSERSDTMILVCLDMDGVILDSLGPALQAMKEALRDLGKGEYEIERLRDLLNNADEKERMEALGISSAERDQFIQTWSQYKQEKRTKLFPNIDDIIPEIQSLAERLLLVTGSTESEAKQALRNFEIYQYFDGVYCGSNDKSDALNEISQGYEESTLIFIGDSLSDARSAMRLNRAYGKDVIFYGYVHEKLVEGKRKKTLGLANKDLFRSFYDQHNLPDRKFKTVKYLTAVLRDMYEIS